MKTLTEKSLDKLNNKQRVELSRLISISKMVREQGLYVNSIKSPLGNCYFTASAIWGKIIVKKSDETEIVLKNFL
jgi:hypothetical protein